MGSTEFAFSYNRLIRLITVPLLAGPRQSTIRVDADHVVVQMGLGGWTFAARVPRSSIIEARQVEGRVWGWGAHGFRGRWLVNGSGLGLVKLTISPEARCRVVGVPLRLRELTLSLEDPQGFVEAVSP
jgi:hypothetical protein